LLSSTGIQQAWQREQESTAKSAKVVSAVRTEIVEAQRLLEAAKGDVEAAKKLPGDLQAFVGVYLDDDQRRELAVQPIAEVVSQLERFRKIGAVELESYEATGRKVTFVEPEKDKPKPAGDKLHLPR
jgi:predicted transcriptional regulator